MLISNDAEYSKLLDELAVVSEQGGTVAIDTETSGLSIYIDDVLRGICLAFRLDSPDTPFLSYFVPVSCPDSVNFPIEPIVDALNKHTGLHAYHHAIFDWAALALACPSFVPPSRFHDTMVFSWLQDENATHALKQLASIYLGEDSRAEQAQLKAMLKGLTKADVYRELRLRDEWKHRPAAEAREEASYLAEASKKTWGTLTAEDLAPYAAKDAELTLLLTEVQVGHWGSDEPALKRELDFQHILYKLIRTGIRIDPNEAKRQCDEAEQRLAELESGFSCNIHSSKQLASLMYDEWELPILNTTPSGKPKTDKETLEKHIGHPGIRNILEAKKLRKAISTYYKPLLRSVGRDGKVHASFSSTRTVTGRLSCSGPNLMTIPRGDTLEGVRNLFIPDDGYELWGHDIVSAEMFFMADFCGDENLIRALVNGEDLHSMTASMVFGPDFTGLQRRLGKNLNYGFPYGIKPKRFSAYMVAGTAETATSCKYWNHPAGFRGYRGSKCGICHACEADQILQGFREAYPKLVKLMDGLEKIAKRDGKLPLHKEGRYRHFKSPGRLVPYHTALNSIVQGGVAEFMKDVMAEVDGPFEDLGVRLHLQVHDELVTGCPIGTGEKVAAIIKEASDKHNPLSIEIRWDSKPWSAHD